MFSHHVAHHYCTVRHQLCTANVMGPMNSRNLAFLCLPAGSPHVTAWDTAAAVGVPTSCVAKTMTLLVDQQPHLVVTRGDQRIDMHKARSYTLCNSSCSPPNSSYSLLYLTHSVLRSSTGPAAAGTAVAQQACADGPAAPAWLGGVRLLRLQRTLRTARVPVAAAVKLLV